MKYLWRARRKTSRLKCRVLFQTLAETYGELSRLFGDYYALSVTQLFAFSDKHAAFERNGNMSLFEKFELAREVSEICDSVVPLIKVVIVEGGKRGDATVSSCSDGDDDDDDVVLRAAATGYQRGCNAAGCWDRDQWHRRNGKSALPLATAASARQRTETCRNPFGAIMEDDVDRTWRQDEGRRGTSAAGKHIELEVYSRSVSYFHERVDDGAAAARRRPSLRAQYTSVH